MLHPVTLLCRGQTMARKLEKTNPDTGISVGEGKGEEGDPRG